MNDAMPNTFTAQTLFEILRKLPEEDRKHMKVTISDDNDERSDVDDYTTCLNRVFLCVKRTFTV